MIPIETIQEISETLTKLKTKMNKKGTGLLAVYAYVVLFVTAVLYLAGSVTSASFHINEWSFTVRALISAAWAFMLFVSGGFVSDLKK